VVDPAAFHDGQETETMPHPSSRQLLFLLGIPLLILVLVSLRGMEEEPIRVGVVHALTGVMAQSERELVDAVRLAVENINASGGLLGRRLDLIVADSRSDDRTAADAAERLITRERVSVLFACWTSACRKALKPVVERHRHLMFYPLQYEGLEQSSHLIYMGAAPNQQIIPGTRWALDRFGSRIFLLGSDYIFPRTANLIIRDLVTAARGEILGERYVPLDATDPGEVISEIQRLQPDAIINTLNGAANRDVFAALKAAGLGRIPVVSFSLAEPELHSMLGDDFHPAHYAVWGYFQSLEDPDNRRFVDDVHRRFGTQRVVSDPIVSSYNGVNLWAAAVREAGTDDPAQVGRSLGRISVDGPSGIVSLDAATGHQWRRVYVGHAREDGQFDAVEISKRPVRPTPFPAYRSRAQWQEQIATLSAGAASSTPGPSGATP
jgi:urea transport system substrate-binding protein